MKRLTLPSVGDFSSTQLCGGSYSSRVTSVVRHYGVCDA